MLSVLYVTARELQECPAAIRIDRLTGRAELLINRDTFYGYEPFARRFIVAHELGHWLLGADERVADAFALGLLHGTEPGSLRRSLRTLLQLDIRPERFRSLCRLALRIDRQRPRTLLDQLLTSKPINHVQTES